MLRAEGYTAIFEAGGARMETCPAVRSAWGQPGPRRRQQPPCSRPALAANVNNRSRNGAQDLGQRRTGRRLRPAGPHSPPRPNTLEIAGRQDRSAGADLLPHLKFRSIEGSVTRPGAESSGRGRPTCWRRFLREARALMARQSQAAGPNLSSNGFRPSRSGGCSRTSGWPWSWPCMLTPGLGCRPPPALFLQLGLDNLGRARLPSCLSWTFPAACWRQSARRLGGLIGGLLLRPWPAGPGFRHPPGDPVPGRPADSMGLARWAVGQVDPPASWRSQRPSPWPFQAPIRWAARWLAGGALGSRGPSSFLRMIVAAQRWRAPALPLSSMPRSPAFFYTIEEKLLKGSGYRPVVMLLVCHHLLGRHLGRPAGPGRTGTDGQRLESRRQPGAGAPGVAVSSRCCDRSGWCCSGVRRPGGLRPPRPIAASWWCCNGYGRQMAGATGGGHGVHPGAG